MLKAAAKAPAITTAAKANGVYANSISGTNLSGAGYFGYSSLAVSPKAGVNVYMYVM